MQSRFLESNINLGFPEKGKSILVAVSGGVDSMVLASLYCDAGYKIGVVHCNYQLRGEDSEADEALVKDWCLDRNIPFHLKRVDTESLASQSNSSIQMIAREERYAFFEELMEEYNYESVALAHHADDRVESLLLNVLRGTGFRGFQGMPSKREKYIRPLLGFRKNEIREYAQKHHVPYREDASNQEAYYKRNWVRLKLLPMLQAHDSEAFQKLLIFCERAESELPNYQKWIDRESSRIKTQDRISVEELSHSKASFTVLREILEPMGFNSDLVFEALDLVESSSGKEVRSESHRIVKHRNDLIISPLESLDSAPKLSYQTISRDELKSLKTESNVALLDAEMLDESELKLRKWGQGDRFKPLGMNQWKLLSDFFIDQKLSIPEKEKVWLLRHRDEIVWVIGHRIDNRFKISDNTQKVLKVTCQR